jgi:hypothetical protein
MKLQLSIEKYLNIYSMQITKILIHTSDKYHPTTYKNLKKDVNHGDARGPFMGYFISNYLRNIHTQWSQYQDQANLSTL